MNYSVLHPLETKSKKYMWSLNNCWFWLYVWFSPLKKKITILCVFFRYKDPRELRIPCARRALPDGRGGEESATGERAAGKRTASAQRDAGQDDQRPQAHTANHQPSPLASEPPPLRAIPSAACGEAKERRRQRSPGSDHQPLPIAGRQTARAKPKRRVAKRKHARRKRTPMRGCPRDVQPGRFDFPGAAETQAGGVNPEHAHFVACRFECFATARSHTKAESFIVWDANAAERLARHFVADAASPRQFTHAAAFHANRRVAAIRAHCAAPKQSTHDAHFECTLAVETKRKRTCAVANSLVAILAVAIPAITTPSHAIVSHSAYYRKNERWVWFRRLGLRLPLPRFTVIPVHLTSPAILDSAPCSLLLLLIHISAYKLLPLGL